MKMRCVDYTTAKDLQELGYNGDYQFYVDDEGRYTNRDSMMLYDWMIKAPRIDDVMYWITAKYDIHFRIEPILHLDKKSYMITILGDMFKHIDCSHYGECAYEYETYQYDGVVGTDEDLSVAMENAVKFVIDYIKKK